MVGKQREMGWGVREVGNAKSMLGCKSHQDAVIWFEMCCTCKKPFKHHTHCREEWEKIPPSQCQRLVDSYNKYLLKAVSTKGQNKPTMYLLIPDAKFAFMLI